MNYQLSLTTWRCGLNESKSIPKDLTISLGIGRTSLLNVDGYSCCIGQFCSQSGVPPEHLRNIQFPSGVLGDYYSSIAPFVDVSNRCTNLTNSLIEINDSSLPIPMKILKIKKVLKQYGHTLTVVM